MFYRARTLSSPTKAAGSAAMPLDAEMLTSDERIRALPIWRGDDHGRPAQGRLEQ